MMPSRHSTLGLSHFSPLDSYGAAVPIRRRRPHLVAAALALAIVGPASANAQTTDDAPEPSFTLATSQAFTTRDTPVVHLTFRALTQLDFRVYRVNDAPTFFAGLRDPHTLGGREALVPEERSWLERIARWKSARRAAARSFVRRQFTRPYRQERRRRADQQDVQLRQTVGYASFAQVPVLNRSQLVEFWREILPAVRDPEGRRIPLEVRDPGVYVVEAVNGLLKAYTIVLISDVGMITKASPGELVVFTADRATGQPVADCDIQTLADQQVVATSRTGPDGLAHLAIGELQPDSIVSIASCPEGTAVTDPGTWYVQSQARELLGYVYTDKPVYRPGHTAHIKGILRWRAQDGLASFDRAAVEVVVTDPNDKVIARRMADVDDYGSVYSSVPIPEGAALGYYSVRLNSESDVAYGSFEVQEYRRPEFNVTVTTDAEFALQETTIEAAISARYFFGQPVANALLTYAIYQSPYESPLRWADSSDEGFGGGWYGGGVEVGQFQSRLDESGLANVQVPLPTSADGRDYSYRIEARVTDSSGREVSGDTRLFATYGTFLLGTSTDRYLVRPGTASEFRVRAVSYEGVVQAQLPVRVRLERLIYDQSRYGPPRAELVSDDRIVTDAEGRGTWTVSIPPRGGSYRLLATATSGPRTVSGTTHIWVPGDREEAVGDDFTRMLELVADRTSYQPGETARLMVRGESFDTALLLTKEGQHVSHASVVATRENEVVEVPIEEDDVGGTYVNVVFLKDDRLYRAERRLNVPPVGHAITVEILADADVGRPNQPTTLTVRTTNGSGVPVKAQLSLGVIDEAVYSIRDDSTADPLRFFYRREYSRVGTQYSREYSFLGFSGTQQLLLAQRRRPLQLSDFKGGPAPRPHVRKEFPDAIYWVADLETDDDGLAEVRFDYPDALTSWRVTARAVTTDTDLGVGIARTTTTKDVIVRVITPRFLTQGDEVVIPAIVHNYLPDPAPIARSLRATGRSPMPPEPEIGDPVLLAPGEESRTDWRFRADSVGTATLTGEATSAEDGDAVRIEIPVQPFGLAREVHGSGALRASAEETIELEIPTESNPDARTIRLALAPSLAGTVLSALDVLTSFPYGCTEQILSSFVPTLLVRRTLDTLGLPMTERLRSLDRQVSDGLRRLYEYQHDDGGWGWWRTDPNHPFMTAYALDGLIEVARAGYRVDGWRISNAATALGNLYAEYPRAVPDLKAYLAYVLARAAGHQQRVLEEDADARARLDDLWSARSRLSPYGQALLLLTLDLHQDARATDMAVRLVAAAETEGELSWWRTEDDPLLIDRVDTSVEATAFALKALAPHSTPDGLLDRAVRWLVLNRNQGVYWSSTKQTAMVLSGLLDYMAARGESASPFDVELHVNGTQLDTVSFEPADWAVPDARIVTSAAVEGTNRVRLVKRGPGTLFWSAVAGYHYDGPRIERTGSSQLAIVRRYFKVEPVERRDRIVYRETPVEGDLHEGDLVLVRLTVAGSSDWRYLSLEDPLPAGAEPVRAMDSYAFENPLPPTYESRREYRDDRVAIFLRDLSGGRHELAYLLRMTTPGTFRSMPAQISPMYVPGVSASSDAHTFNVLRTAPDADTATTETATEPSR